MRYLARRFAALLVTFWVALTANFALPRLMPGSPVETMFARYQGKVSPTAIKSMQIAFGLNTHSSIFSQYFTYLRHTLSGNLGVSFSYYPATVTSLIREDLPWTLGLVGVATVIAFVLGTGLGIVGAWRRGTVGSRRGALADSGLVPFALVLGAIPSFWFALVLVYFVAFKFGWFPIGGSITTGDSVTSFHGITSILDHAVLPGLTLTLISMGAWILLMRNNMLTVMGEDFVRFARAKGLRDRAVAYNYAARNAILPVFAQLALALGVVVGGQVFIEIVFSYRGIGYLLLQAVENEDYPLMQGIFLIFTIALLVASFLSDVLYVFLDPRVRTESRS